MRLVVAVAALGVSVTACFGGGQPRSVLDAGPRVPDAEGEVTDVSPQRIVLSGRRSFAIAPTVQSFTTRTHDLAPLSGWRGKYVHIGLDDEQEVVWIAGIGVVIQAPPRRVLYTGVFERLDSEGRAVFSDGTVLRLRSNIETPSEGVETLATISVADMIVVGLVVQ